MQFPVTPSTTLFMPPMPRPELRGNRWASQTMTNDAMASALFPGDADPETAVDDGMGHRDVPIADAGPRRYPPPPPPMTRRGASMPERQKRMMRWYQHVEEWAREPKVRDNNRLIVGPPPRPPPFTAIPGAGVDLIRGIPDAPAPPFMPYPGMVPMMGHMGHMGQMGAMPPGAMGPPGMMGPPMMEQEPPHNGPRQAIPGNRRRSMRQTVAEQQTRDTLAQSTMRPTAPYTFAEWEASCHRWWTHMSRHFDRLSVLLQGASTPLTPPPAPSLAFVGDNIAVDEAVPQADGGLAHRADGGLAHRTDGV